MTKEEGSGTNKNSKMEFCYSFRNFRWDVQRIREQRVIEKLKQRQERNNSRNEEQQEPVNSLWPTIDDIRYLEVCDQLPVSAFGVPIPRYTPR